jgi:hypothetical protein
MSAEILELADDELDKVTGGDCPILGVFKPIVDVVKTVYADAQTACVLADVIPRGGGCGF